MWLSDQGKGDRWDDGKPDQTRELLAFIAIQLVWVGIVVFGQVFFSILY